MTDPQQQCLDLSRRFTDLQQQITSLQSELKKELELYLLYPGETQRRMVEFLLREYSHKTDSSRELLREIRRTQTPSGD